jgi:alpha-tubulin suppressor-like RCC1 family protein
MLSLEWKILLLFGLAGGLVGACTVTFKEPETEIDGGALCGNAVIDVGEECDGPNLAGRSCQSLGYEGGQLACTTQCDLDTGDCQGVSSCGNGQIDGAEECDGAALGGQSCASLGFEGGTLRCSENCLLDTSECSVPAQCGNEAIDPGEACDGSDLGGKTCESLGFLGGTLTCSAACTLDTSGCSAPPDCGNGTVDSGEQCDGSDLDGKTCQDFGFDSGTLSCRDSCTFDTTACARCGDAICHTAFGEDAISCPNDCQWVDIAAGVDHSCAVRIDGRVLCWGANNHGQLGDGTTNPASEPRVVAGLTGVVEVTAGGRFSCVVLELGTVWCWGENSWGQLGDTTTIERHQPVMAGMSNAVAVSALATHVCAIDHNADIWCWGENSSGQIGTAAPANVTQPQLIPELANVLSAAAGGGHSCAVQASCGSCEEGTLYCWGQNNAGQLGIDSTVSTSTPTQVVDMSSAVMVATGTTHSCSAALGATLDPIGVCWGENSHGQLGDGTTNDFQVPTNVTGDIPFVEMACGGFHTCGIEENNTLYCWGAHSHGQLGIGATAGDYPEPQRVFFAPGQLVVAVSTGFRHTCILVDEGVNRAYCFGENSAGQLGDSTTINRDEPVAVTGQ